MIYTKSHHRLNEDTLSKAPTSDRGCAVKRFGDRSFRYQSWTRRGRQMYLEP